MFADGPLSVACFQRAGGKRALAPLPQGVAPPHHDAVFIGDVRLSDFRQARAAAVTGRTACACPGVASACG